MPWWVLLHISGGRGMSLIFKSKSSGCPDEGLEDSTSLNLNTFGLARIYSVGRPAVCSSPHTGPPYHMYIYINLFLDQEMKEMLIYIGRCWGKP